MKVIVGPGYLEELRIEVLAREAPGRVCREKPRARGEICANIWRKTFTRGGVSGKALGQEMPGENLV